MGIEDTTEDTAADIPMTILELEGVPIAEEPLPDPVIKHHRHHQHKPDQRRKRKHQKRKLKREAAAK